MPRVRLSVPALTASGVEKLLLVDQPVPSQSLFGRFPPPPKSSVRARVPHPTAGFRRLGRQVPIAPRGKLAWALNKFPLCSKLLGLLRVRDPKPRTPGSLLIYSRYGNPTAGACSPSEIQLSTIKRPRVYFKPSTRVPPSRERGRQRRTSSDSGNTSWARSPTARSQVMGRVRSSLRGCYYS